MTLILRPRRSSGTVSRNAMKFPGLSSDILGVVLDFLSPHDIIQLMVCSKQMMAAVNTEQVNHRLIPVIRSLGYTLEISSSPLRITRRIWNLTIDGEWYVSLTPYTTPAYGMSYPCNFETEIETFSSVFYKQEGYAHPLSIPYKTVFGDDITGRLEGVRFMGCSSDMFICANLSLDGTELSGTFQKFSSTDDVRFIHAPFACGSFVARKT